jgi:hypothetical protein
LTANSYIRYYPGRFEIGTAGNRTLTTYDTGDVWVHKGNLNALLRTNTGDLSVSTNIYVGGNSNKVIRSTASAGIEESGIFLSTNTTINGSIRVGTPPTNYVSITSTGFMTFKGISCIPQSFIYCEDISSTVVIGATNVYYPFTGGLTSANQEGFTFIGSSYVVCNIKGRYLVNWSAAASYNQSDSQIEGTIMVNSVGLSKVSSMTSFKENTVSYNLSGTGILSLNAGDTIQFCFEAEPGSAIGTLTINHANMSLIQIGG